MFNFSLKKFIKVFLILLLIFVGIIIVFQLYTISTNKVVIYYNNEKFVYYIPPARQRTEQQYDGEKLYIAFGSGLQKPWSFDYWQGEHWGTGDILILFLLFKDGELNNVVGSFSTSSNDEEIKILPMKGTAELNDSEIKNVHLVSEEKDGYKIECFFKKIDLKNADETEVSYWYLKSQEELQNL